MIWPWGRSLLVLLGAAVAARTVDERDDSSSTTTSNRHAAGAAADRRDEAHGFILSRYSREAASCTGIVAGKAIVAMSAKC